MQLHRDVAVVASEFGGSRRLQCHDSSFICCHAATPCGLVPRRLMSERRPRGHDANRWNDLAHRNNQTSILRECGHQVTLALTDAKQAPSMRHRDIPWCSTWRTVATATPTSIELTTRRRSSQAAATALRTASSKRTARRRHSSVACLAAASSSTSSTVCRARRRHDDETTRIGDATTGRISATPL